MNSTQILDALTDIDSAYIAAAQQRLGYLSSPSKQHSFSIRRKLLCLAATVLLLATCFVTAMAVSEDFKEMVFGLLRIEQTEIIPAQDATSPSDSDQMAVDAQNIPIGNVIEATYVHTPEASHARNGIYQICTDGVMMNSGNHYDAYKAENGAFIQLEEKTFCQDYTILGNELHVEFQYVVFDGRCEITYVATDAPFRIPNLSGPLDATLVHLRCMVTGPDGGQWETWYPVLMDIETGTLTDVLAGTGAEKLPDIYQAAISEDRTKMLLVTWDDVLYYADLSQKKLYSVDALSGESVDECVLSGDTLACYVKTPNTFSTYRVWAIDLSTLERREIYTGQVYRINGFDITSHWGNMFAGTRFALVPGAGDSVAALDLATGEITPIEGLEVNQNTQYVASADGEKLLIYNREGSTYYDSVSVVDFGRKAHIQFSRENRDAVNEHTIYWFDNDSVIIRAENGEAVSDYYVYQLLDSE